MSILAIRSNIRSETISMPSYSLKDQNWPIIFGIQLMRIHLLAFWKIPSVASKRVHVRKNHGLRIISGGKCAVSEREIGLKVEKNEISGGAKLADQKHMNNVPLARQRAALTAVKLQMFGGKTRHVWQPIRTWFFVSCPRLDATDGITKSVT